MTNSEYDAEIDRLRTLLSRCVPAIDDAIWCCKEIDDNKRMSEYDALRDEVVAASPDKHRALLLEIVQAGKAILEPGDGPYPVKISGDLFGRITRAIGGRDEVQNQDGE